MPPKVTGKSRKNEYQKITKPKGNKGDPRSFLTTLNAANSIAAPITIHKIEPPIPLSTTNAPNPLSTPRTGVVTWKKRATYWLPSDVVPIPDPTPHRSPSNAARKFCNG